MARLNAANNAESDLSKAVSINDTAIIVDDASVFPPVPYRLFIDGEVVEVTSASANSLTVIRAVEGVASAHNAGAKVENNFTAGTLDELADKAELAGLKKTVNEHQVKKVHEGEMHGFRLTDGKLEYYDGAEWQRVKGDGYPVGNIPMLDASIGNGEVTLTWQDPDDVTISDSNGNIITIARWFGTKIVRKTGSYPVDENDGVLLVDNTIRNQYQTNGFIDSNLTNGTTYYYMLFPYTKEGIITNDSANRVIATPQAYDDLTGSPGPKNLVAGNMQAGYFGEVSSTELISGDALASDIGLTAGTSQHSNAGWLKFAYKGNIQFVAKKPIRYGISWDQINSVNAVYDNQGAQATVNGLTYMVRLMKGAENDPSNNNDTDRDAIGSEWNELMLPIHEHASTGNWAYPNYTGNPSDWGVGFTDNDLLTHNSYGDGSYSWTQETVSSDPSSRVIRGYLGVSSSSWGASSTAYAYRGFRPVLELL